MLPFCPPFAHKISWERQSDAAEVGNTAAEISGHTSCFKQRAGTKGNERWQEQKFYKLFGLQGAQQTMIGKSVNAAYPNLHCSSSISTPTDSQLLQR